MKVITSLKALRETQGERSDLVLVPTMGNLHAGHLALIERARGLGQTVMASIFVNRLQFLPHEDFDTYPRTFEADCAALAAAGCDWVFAPAEAEFYPQPQTFKISPDPRLADILEGQFRPGFFTGVCTVVMKLLACVQPQVAVFGQKDYQQLMVIRQMVRQFAMPIEIVAGPTQRAPDGLALSSRNGYLSAAQRREAVALSQALHKLVEALRAAAASTPAPDLPALQAAAEQALRDRGWAPDYLCVRRRDDLQPPSDADLRAGLASPSHLVALGAAKLGQTRLIDNLEF